MKKIVFTILMMLLISNVSASSIENQIIENGEYTNSYGVTINFENYNKIKDIMSEAEIEEIDQRFYDAIENSKEVKDIESVIIESTYYTIGEDNFLLNEKLLTQEEYNSRLITRTSTSTSHNTNYKYIKLMSSENSNGTMLFYIQNAWQKTPINKSFDVIALRWSGSVVEATSTASGIQDYKDTLQQVNPPYIAYSSTSGNMQYFSDGLGLSQNLVNDASYYVNVLSINATCSGTVNLYGTYQHAQGDLTLAQSQSYTFSESGLGGILYYKDSSIRNTYDNTSGLSISFAC